MKPYYITDLIPYKEDGWDRWYRRVGDIIEYNGKKPPEGIEIYPGTIHRTYAGCADEYRRAKVKGWETNIQECTLEDATVVLEFKDGKKKYDTHNSFSASKVSGTYTNPVKGKYTVTYEIDLEVGQELHFDSIENLSIRKSS